MSERTPTQERLTRAQKRQANRERILSAARTVFGARGYHAATIEDIADEAGLSNGAVYYNFANKEDLFFSLLEQWRSELLDDLRSAEVRLDGIEPQRTLQDEIGHVVETLQLGREWRLLLLEFVTYAARNPRFSARFVSGRQVFKAALARALEQRIAVLGLEPAVAPEQLVVLVTALVNGLAIDELTEPGAIPANLLATALTALMDPRRLTEGANVPPINSR